MTYLRAARTLSLWIIATLATLQLCTSATPALAQAGKVEKPDITFGVFPITNYGVVYLSIQQGFFKEEGLNVTPRVMARIRSRASSAVTSIPAASRGPRFCSRRIAASLSFPLARLTVAPRGRRSSW
jgi:hypothetical protein